MNGKPKPAFARKEFLIVFAFTTLLAVVLTLVFFYLFDALSPLPIPNPIDYEYVIYQSLFIMLINGLTHAYWQRKADENTFGYLSSTLILAGFNLVIIFVLWDIRRMPSINEVKRLYGDSGVPDDLLWLSTPLVLVPALIGMFGIPYFLRSRKQITQSTAKRKVFQEKIIQLLKTYLLVAGLIITVNLIYYWAYQAIVDKEMQTDYSLDTMIQVNLVMTAIAALLYLYLLEYSENALSTYLLWTVIFTASAFLAGLPHPDGQPIYDESLWLNIPLALFSTLGELIGIPLVFKRLGDEKRRKQEKEERWS